MRDLKKLTKKDIREKYDEAEDWVENFNHNSQSKLKEKLRRDKKSFKHYLKGAIF